MTRVLTLGAVLLVGGAMVAPAAQAACGGLLAQLGLQPRCPPPPPANSGSPDPGGVESPDQPAPAPGKSLGFSAGVYLAGDGTAERELNAARTAGANVQRSAIQWRMLQPRAGSPLPPPGGTAPPGSTLERIDRFYAAAVARDITPIFVMGWAPVWATKYRGCPLLDFGCQAIAQSSHNLPPDLGHIGHYEAYVAAVKARWPRALIESWNEPDAFWGHPAYAGSRAFPASPEQFRAIQCAAYAGSKSIDDDAVLAAGWAMARGGEYVRRVHAAGGPNCWDVANVHAYPTTELGFGANSSVAYVLDLLRRIRRDGGDADPIWVTETGYTTTGPIAVSESAQADASRRLYNRLITMPDVGGVLFHTLRDAPFPSAPYNQPSSSDYGYGFLHRDWSPKPVFCEFAELAGRAC